MSIAWPDVFVSGDQTVPIGGVSAQLSLQMHGHFGLFCNLAIPEQQWEGVKQALARVTGGYRIEGCFWAERFQVQ